MKTRAFKQVDVFTAKAYKGNPLAVVLDGEGLSPADMAHFARWTNLSETTFLLPPTAPSADYRVRIFTPGGELPFAGHPTLGSCHAWREAGGRPKAEGHIVQQCEAGLVTIRQEPEAAAHAGSAAGWQFAAPPLRRSAPSPSLLAQVASALGVKAGQVVAAQVLDNGPEWFTLLLDSPRTVLQLAPNHLELKNLKLKVGVAGIYRTSGAIDSGAPADLEVRAFAAAIGVEEDPVTGSLNASLAQWLIAEGHLPARYAAAQGRCLQRDGQVRLEQDASGQVWVGGDSVTCISGTVTL